MDKVTKFIKQNEGFRRFPYKCTAGRLTVGWGRNIEDVGVSDDEAELMLRNDILESQLDLCGIFPFFPNFPEEKKIALVDMRFNLGSGGFRKFRKMIFAIRSGDWVEAAMQAEDSKWEKQVGDRAKRVLELLRS